MFQMDAEWNNVEKKCVPMVGPYINLQRGHAKWGFF